MDLTNLECGIYCFKNTVDGKIYVGSSKRMTNRRNQHLFSLRKGKGTNKHFQNAWNKYGELSFVYGVLEYCSYADLALFEDLYIAKYQSKNVDKGYNIMPSLRPEMTAEIKAKISASRKGKLHTAEWKVNASKRMMGHTTSPETASKISKAQIGKFVSEESRAKMSANFNRNRKPRTQETFDKISKALTGKKLSTERIAKMRIASSGKKQSIETIAKRIASKLANGTSKGTNIGYKHTDEARENMKQAQLKRLPPSQETIEKCRVAAIKREAAKRCLTRSI